jgi:hypothetical protein
VWGPSGRSVKKTETIEGRDLRRRATIPPPVFVFGEARLRAGGSSAVEADRRCGWAAVCGRGSGESGTVPSPLLE